MTQLSDLVGEPLTDAYDIAERIAAIATLLPEGDGVGWFCRIQASMSELVAQDVASTEFEDPEVLERIDVHLIGAFLDAIAADLDHGTEEVRRSWRPLFRQRANRNLHPVRFALAGINAHIASDLPRAVLATCEETGHAPTRESPLYRDYCRINDVMKELQPRAELEVFGPLLQGVDGALGEVDDQIQSFGFAAAREAAWMTAAVGYELPGPLDEWHLATVDRTTGFVSRLILAGGRD